MNVRIKNPVDYCMDVVLWSLGGLLILGLAGMFILAALLMAGIFWKAASALLGLF